MENDPDIVAMVAASAALTLSGAPFMGPIGGARVGFINNEYVLNPQHRRDGGEQARSRRRRHAGRGADGRIGGQGAVRGDHARRGDVRPPALPAGDRGHHQARREGREGAARLRDAGHQGDREGNARHRRTGSAQGLCDPGQGRASGRGCRRQEEGDGALLPGRRRQSGSPDDSWSPACSRTSKPRSCAGTSSTPASASTAAIS